MKSCASGHRQVLVVDGCGAGATYSAGFIYGWLQDWPLEQSVRFATAAASLKVTRSGLEMWPVDEIQKKAAGLKVETSIRHLDGEVLTISFLFNRHNKSLMNTFATLLTDQQVEAHPSGFA